MIYRTGNLSISRETVRQALLAADPEAILANRHGARVAHKLEGLFRSQPRADAPLNRVYIDHTQIDVWVFVVVDGKRYRVRPWLTLLVDDNTSMPTGFAISFRTPTAGDVLAALRHAILPKTYTHKWVLSGSLQLVWEVMGIPYEIVMDNGLDLQASSVYAAILAMGCDVETSPPMEPQKKARAERMFGTLNTKLFHRFGGTTFGSTDNTKKYEYDPQKFVCVEFEELLEALHITFEEIACEYHKGIQDFPIRRWREGVRRYPVRLPADLDEFDVQMSIRKTRTIGNLGISFLGLFYADERLADIKRKLGSRRTVVIFIKPEDLSTIHVLDPETQKAVRVSCTQKFDAPYPLYLHVELVRLRRQARRPGESSDDPDMAGTGPEASAARAAAKRGLIEATGARQGGLPTHRGNAYAAQAEAMDARQAMEKPRPPADSGAASAHVARNLLDASSLSEENEQ